MNSLRSIAHSRRVRSATFVNPSHRKYFLSVLLLLCPIAAAAQGTAPSWVRAFGSEGNGPALDQRSNIANAIKAAPDHSLYVGGQFSGTATFGSTTITAAGGYGIFLAKYSPSGSLLWIAQTAQAGAGGNQAANGIDLDGDGNVYVTGGFYGNATFYSANPADKQIRTASGTVPAIFLAKYTPAGVLLWVQTVTSDQFGPDPNVPMIGKGVAVNAVAGTVYVGSFSQADLTFSSADGSTHMVSGVGLWHMALAKYDLDGNFHWAATNFGGGNTGSYGVAVDAQDNSYAIGWFEGSATFSSADDHAITIDGFGGRDIFMAKYDPNGNAKWANHIGGGFQAIPCAVTTGPDAEITLAGFVGNGSPTIVSSQPPGADINLGSGIITNPGNLEGVVATYNPDGVAVRAARHGGPSNESATGVAYDSRDNLYVAVLAQGSTKPELFVDKYSGKNLLWEATADAGAWIIGVEQSLTPRLTVDDAGTVSVAGGYSGTATFGDIKLSGTGTTEVFVAELKTAFANQSADLSIAQSAPTTSSIAGTGVSYQTTVHNAGPADAINVVVTDTLPVGVNFVSGPCTGTAVLTCNEGTLVSGASKSFTVQVKIPANYLSNLNETTAQIVNKVSVTSGVTDPNLANNTSSLTTTLTAAAHLELTMTGTPDPVHEGNILTYTMNFTNTGPSDAIQGNILDYLPPGVSFVSSSVLPCGGGVGVVLCNLGPVVPAGFTLSFPVQVSVPANFLQSGVTSSNATNTAMIYSDTIDLHPGDNPASVTTTIVH